MGREVRHLVGVGVLAAFLLLAGCKSLCPRSKTTPPQAVSDEQIGNGVWAVLADLPVARFGGADRSTSRYDPRRNTYTRTADLPEGAQFIVHGSCNGCIYAVHGETDRETYAEGVLKYEVAADKWTKLNLPRIEQRKWYLSQHSTHAAIGSKLFILGGWSRVTNTRSNRATYFDMATEKFGEVARMPRGRCCGICGVVDGKLYLAGGFWQWVDDVSDCKETWAFIPKR